MPNDLSPRGARSTGLVDVLDRVLDKGLVVAGDIRVSLAEVELLTIRIRLIVCSLDKAQAIGLDWWKHDRYFSPGARNELVAENERLRAQLRRLETDVAGPSFVAVPVPTTDGRKAVPRGPRGARRKTASQAKK
jgi:hypothetical protein